MAMCIRLTYVRLSIHCTVHAMMVRFLEAQKLVLTIFFLHRLNGNTFYVHRQYTWYLKILRYSSLVVVLGNFAGRH